MNIINLIMNVLVVVLSPIIAVLIGQFLQEKSEKRKDKMNIYRSLVSSRIYGWTVESVNALNLIELVFYKDKDVCGQWRKYYETLTFQQPIDNEHLRKIQFEQDELIRVMGKALSYSDEAIAQILRNPYMPVGMSNEIRNQQEFKNMQIEAMQTMISRLSGDQMDVGRK